MENDVVCGGHYLRSLFVRAAHKYITAEVTHSQRLRPLQRLQSSCNCEEIAWEMGWERQQGLCRARRGPASKHCPAQAPGAVEKLLAPQVKQQSDGERGKWNLTRRGFSSLSISEGRAGEAACCQNKGTGGSVALQAPA